jgi:hypothetical protein
MHAAILAIFGGGDGGSRNDWAAHMLASMSDEDRIALAHVLAPGLAILPADMTAEQAARSLAGSAMADRVRVSAPDIYALLVEARRATWRQMVAVMGESGDE